MVLTDELDNKILGILDKDGRIPAVQIAEELGVSRQVISARITRLEERKVILGHYTIFDSGVVGYNWYRVLFRLLNVSKSQKQEFLQYLKTHDHVAWLGEVGGRWDIAVNFACESPSAFNTIHEEISVKFGPVVKDVEVLVYVDIYDYSRSYLGSSGGSRKKFFHQMSSGGSAVIDELDKRLIRALSQQARVDNTALGAQLSVTRNTIKNRIDRLIEKKVILGFRTFVDLKKLGYESNMLFLQINRMDRERETELYLYLQMLDQVTFVVKHIGKWKVGLEIETQSSHDFQEVLLNIRSEFSDLISDYDTFPLLQDHMINYFPEGILNN
jgi:DNA-binding Lrp family transcriptional regulator